jgi:hypothetical protein
MKIHSGHPGICQIRAPRRAVAANTSQTQLTLKAAPQPSGRKKKDFPFSMLHLSFAIAGVDLFQ